MRRIDIAGAVLHRDTSCLVTYVGMSNTSYLQDYCGCGDANIKGFLHSVMTAGKCGCIRVGETQETIYEMSERW